MPPSRNQIPGRVWAAESRHAGGGLGLGTALPPCARTPQSPLRGRERGAWRRGWASGRRGPPRPPGSTGRCCSGRVSGRSAPRPRHPAAGKARGGAIALLLPFPPCPSVTLFSYLFRPFFPSLFPLSSLHSALGGPPSGGLPSSLCLGCKRPGGCSPSRVPRADSRRARAPRGGLRQERRAGQGRAAGEGREEARAWRRAGRGLPTSRGPATGAGASTDREARSPLSTRTRAATWKETRSALLF